ncbi:MAG: DUF4367 domain-containing protein [Bacillaceae bacterium]|nr:DUF4367 domain-containing protein [Bacillaceae bacterium]
MRRFSRMLIPILVLMLIAVGCGTKSMEDVVGDLDNQLESLKSYKTSGKLTLQTGDTPQQYDMEIWYKKPNYYRIALTSQERNITQIILRNDDGVFVLTPHLNKSFRFQSGWPEKHGQVYLYESLVKSILQDEQRKFEAEDDHYVFEVKADYQNRSLTSQKIWLTEDLLPSRVEVMDTDYNPMVLVEFENFDMNVEFDEDAFDKERNMSAALMVIPAMGDGNEELADDSFGVIHPAYVPEGVTLSSVEQVKEEENDVVVMKYTGVYNYTLMEERPQAASVSYPYGEPVDLGFTFGVLTGDQKKTLVWTYNGVEFKLSGNMPDEEMIQVAKSVYGQSGK